MSIFGRKKEDGTDMPEGGVPPAPRDPEIAVPTFRAPAANSAPAVGMPPKPAAPPAAGADRKSVV